MTSPPFKVGDRVVCVDSRDCDLISTGVYVIQCTAMCDGRLFVSVDSDDDSCQYAASRFTLEQPTPAPDDYPDSVEDYAHNRPHHIIAWGAASLLLWLSFFAGLLLGWWLL